MLSSDVGSQQPFSVTDLVEVGAWNIYPIFAIGPNVVVSPGFSITCDGCLLEGYSAFAR